MKRTNLVILYGTHVAVSVNRGAREHITPVFRTGNSYDVMIYKRPLKAPDSINFDYSINHQGVKN